MPALVLFGRRWRMGSDDVFCPALQKAAFQSGILLPVLLAVRMGVLTTKCCSLVQSYYIAALLICGVKALFLLIAAGIASRGSITDEHPRRYMPGLLYLLVFMEVCLPSFQFANYVPWDTSDTRFGGACQQQ